MKKCFFLYALCVVVAVNAQEIDEYVYKKLVTEIVKVQAPQVRNGFLIFTEDQSYRHAGIAFEFEDYKTVHNFTRVPTDREGQSEDVLFYILEIPNDTTELNYRVVLDGLWTKDPQNDDCFFDYTLGVTVSKVKTPLTKLYRTKILENGFVQFYFQAAANENVRLAGSFNGWDPFMYEMEEVRSGEYFLTLPLPAGEWTYAFFIGSTQYKDPTNPKTVFSKEEKAASVIAVP